MRLRSTQRRHGVRPGTTSGPTTPPSSQDVTGRWVRRPERGVTRRTAVADRVTARGPRGRAAASGVGTYARGRDGWPQAPPRRPRRQTALGPTGTGRTRGPPARSGRGSPRATSPTPACGEQARRQRADPAGAVDVDPAPRASRGRCARRARADAQASGPRRGRARAGRVSSGVERAPARASAAASSSTPCAASDVEQVERGRRSSPSRAAGRRAAARSTRAVEPVEEAPAAAGSTSCTTTARRGSRPICSVGGSRQSRRRPG